MILNGPDKKLIILKHFFLFLSSQSYCAYWLQKLETWNKAGGILLAC